MLSPCQRPRLLPPSRWGQLSALNLAIVNVRPIPPSEGGPAWDPGSATVKGRLQVEELHCGSFLGGGKTNTSVEI